MLLNRNAIIDGVFSHSLWIGDFSAIKWKGEGRPAAESVVLDKVDGKSLK